MDVINRAKTLYSADTSQAKAAVQSLRGVERDRAKEVLNNLNAENAKLESSLKTWAKVGVAVGSVVGAYALLKKAHSAYLEDVRLQSAAAGANVDRLKEATRGLVEEDNLLAFAGKAQHGVWKLNQQEMERVLKGAMALRKTMGVELQPTVDALTESIAKGSTRALKEFGIEAKDKEGALRELDKIVQQVGGNFDMAGDDIARGGVKAKDALDNLMGSLGRLVEALGPAIEGLAEFVDAAASALGDSSSKNSSTSGDPEQIKKLLGSTWDNLAKTKDPELRKHLEAVEADLWKDYYAALAKQVQSVNADLIKDMKAATDMDVAAALAEEAFDEAKRKALAASRKKGGRGGGLTTTSDYAGRVYFPGPGDELGVGGGIGTGGIDYTDLSGFQGDEAKKLQARQAAAAAEADKLLAAQAEAEKHKKLFDAVFGSPDEISATTVAIGLAHEAFEGMSGAIAQSFEAWVTGAESAGEVFKRATGALIHSMGVELAQVGAKHAILALVDAATLNFAGAGMHAAASGVAFGGAATMFTVATAMGYGASKPSGAGAASAGAGHALGGGLGARGGGGGDQTTYIYLAPDWDDETPSQRRQKLARAVRRGGVNRTSNIVLNR